MNRPRSRDYRYGEPYYKHFRNGKLIKNEEDPFMHFQQRKSFFADNPKLEEVSQNISSESFDDAEYDQLLQKYSDGGTYSSHGRAMENQRQVQNVKDKITSMKKKFQSLALVCDYVDGMEKYERALETDPDSEMVQELTHKLENLRNAPKIHTNEHSYVSTSVTSSAPKQYGVSLAEKRRRAALVANQQTSSVTSSRCHSRATSPSRHHPASSSHDATQNRSLNVPSMRVHESSPSRGVSCAAHHVHDSSPHRFLSVPQRSRTSSTSKPETKDVATQVGRARISSDSDDESEKQRDSGISTHDEDEEKANGRKKMDNRLKRDLLKPKFFLNDRGNLVRVGSDDSIVENASETVEAAPAETTADATDKTTPVIKIYYDFVSSASRALFLFLKIADVEFEAVPVQLRAGEQFQPEFQKLSPARRLPVMDDDGFILREATAICRYIADRNELAARWRVSMAAEDAKARARMDEYLSWHQSQLRPTCLQLFSQATLTPILANQPPNFIRLHGLKTELDNHCRYMENVFLDESFIGGDEMGICDLLAVCELMQPYAAGFDVRQSNLRQIRQWMERVKREARPFFDDVHEDISKIWDTKGRFIIEDYEEFLTSHSNG